MTTVLVTGASGFLGLNLTTALQRRTDITVRTCDRSQPLAALDAALAGVDAIVHLEAIYRTAREGEFAEVHVGWTRTLLDRLGQSGQVPAIVYASSTQAEGDSPYGRSRRSAEELLSQYASASGASVVLLRLAHEFGKWCRPDDNSVVATFCDRVARGQDLVIHDPAASLRLMYVDDIVAAILASMAAPPAGVSFVPVSPVWPLTVGELAERIRGFRESRASLIIPDCADPLTRRLYATYLSHLDGADFAYSLQKREDPRGSLVEYFKNDHFGQVFVSRTKPGVTRGNHYHDTKVEKFCVLEGDAVVCFRHLVTGAAVKHTVRGVDATVIDIPPGYAHSIENVGTSEMIVLFWANEIFDPARPDTYPREVLRA